MHAFLNVKLNYSQCTKNPTEGDGYIANLKTDNNLKTGTAKLKFYSACDSKVTIVSGTGNYKDIEDEDIAIELY